MQAATLGRRGYSPWQQRLHPHYASSFYLLTLLRVAGATAEVRFEIVPSQLTGWRFFYEAGTTLHLAAGGVSPTRKTLPGLVTATLEVCR